MRLAIAQDEKVATICILTTRKEKSSGRTISRIIRTADMAPSVWRYLIHDE